MLYDNPYVVACCVLVAGTLVDMVPRIPRASNETKTTKLNKQKNWKNELFDIIISHVLSFYYILRQTFMLPMATIL